MNPRSLEGGTPLHLAVQEHHIDIVRLLLEKGADPKLASAVGCTPLHLATGWGLVECTRLLLDHGADPQPAEGSEAPSPLFLAAQYGHLAVVELLVARGAAVDKISGGSPGNSPLIAAAMAGHVEIVRFLVVKAGADVNMTNLRGDAALHAAATVSGTSYFQNLAL